MTLFFRQLAELELEGEASGTAGAGAPALGMFDAAFYDPERTAAVAEELQDWLRVYAARLRQEGRSQVLRRAGMNAVNPRYVPRNYLAQQAIDAAEQGDLSELHALMAVLRKPYEDQQGCERFAARRPDWARNRAGCSMLSCSS